MVSMRLKTKILNQEPYWLASTCFIVLKLCIHLFTITNYELHRDEMLYFNMGDHLAFGYLTVPPVTGFLAFLVKTVFGYSVFGIRLIPVIFGGATLFIIAKMVKDLGGGILALTISALGFIFSPGLLLFFSLFTPNAVEYFLWSLSIYLIFKLLQTENNKLWIWIGIISGIAFLTKYSVLFLISGFFLAFLTSKQRKLLKSSWFYGGILAGIAVISPNIIWQFNHNWPVLYHLEQLKKTQLELLSFTHFFSDLFHLTSAFLILLIIGLLSLLVKQPDFRYRTIGTGILITALLFFISKGKAYYISGLFSTLFAFGGYLAEKYFNRKLLAVSALTAVTTYSMISLPLAIPVLTPERLYKYAAKTTGWTAAPFMRWEDGKIHPISQVYSDMTGWKELSDHVAKAYYHLNTEEQDLCTIFCENSYGYAGAIHFYGKKYNLPEPVTFHESYIFWAPDSIPSGPVIYVYFNENNFRELFNNIEEIGCVQDTFYREKGVKVFLCRNPKVDISDVYRISAHNHKKIFTRKIIQ